MTCSCDKQGWCEAMQQELPGHLWDFCRQDRSNMIVLADARRIPLDLAKRVETARPVAIKRKPPAVKATLRPQSASRPGKATTTVIRTSRLADCIHLGDFVDPLTQGKRPDALGVLCLCEGRHLRQCDVHGQCRVNDPRNGAQTCQEGNCDRYVSNKGPIAG